MADIINEIAIQRMVKAGVKHPILDLIRKIDDLIRKIEREKINGK